MRCEKRWRICPCHPMHQRSVLWRRLAVSAGSSFLSRCVSEPGSCRKHIVAAVAHPVQDEEGF